MKINTLAVRNPYLDKAGQLKQKQKIIEKKLAMPINNTNNVNKISMEAAMNINKGTIIDVKI